MGTLDNERANLCVTVAVSTHACNPFLVLTPSQVSTPSSRIFGRGNGPSDPKQISYFPTTNFHRSRIKETVLTRLRIDHARLIQDHLMDRHWNAQYHFCEVTRLSVAHLPLYCSSLSSAIVSIPSASTNPQLIVPRPGRRLPPFLLISCPFYVQDVYLLCPHSPQIALLYVLQIAQKLRPKKKKKFLSNGPIKHYFLPIRLSSVYSNFIVHSTVQYFNRFLLISFSFLS